MKVSAISTLGAIRNKISFLSAAMHNVMYVYTEKRKPVVIPGTAGAAHRPAL
jgi:hypothetical protein